MLATAENLATWSADPQIWATREKICYRRQNLEELSLPPASFNLVYSSLTLHYIRNLERLFATARQTLVPGGCLLFSAEHPIYTAPLNQSWTVDAKGLKSWPVNNYQMEGERASDWIVPGVIKQHRTLGTVLNPLVASGFNITHVEEWGPSAEQAAAAPELAEERERPMLVLIRAMAF